MSRSKTAHLLFVGATLVSGAAAAQGIVGGHIQVAPGHLRLGVGFPPIAPMKRLVRLTALPGDVVRLSDMPLWNPASRAAQAQFPTEALAVQRDRTFMGYPCDPATDQVYLRSAIAKGFRLVSFHAEPLTAPDGFALGQPLDAVFVAREATIKIRQPIFSWRRANTMACWSGYRLAITLEGPVGIAPFGKDHFGAGGSHPR